MNQVEVAVHRQASLNIRSVVLPRANWKCDRLESGALAFTPDKGTWYGHIIRGRSRWDVTLVPMVSCPSCRGILFLSHKEDTARAIKRMVGATVDIPVAHSIDHLGRVSPDVLCMHIRHQSEWHRQSVRCDFHRQLVLDRWNKTRKLYAVAYVDLTQGEHGSITIDYCHAVDRREALHQFGSRKNVRLIDAGPAVGFFVDEKTGKVTVD